ncbi:hypothetical protein FG386_003037 [Cryptosporidium ryanae]|uniref:uncharacterized protein n=1 Tax=Cryptosporidium ryanae TaxID=515981 RepID=UPI00351A1B44|nr:hypothetical protein FG386_003037 [Cryptosporidium ryanae]
MLFSKLTNSILIIFICFWYCSCKVLDSRSPSGGITVNGYAQKPGIFYFLYEEIRWRDHDLPFYNMIMSVIANSFINLVNNIDKGEEGLLLHYSKEIGALAKKGELINSVYKSFLTVKGSDNELKIYEEHLKPMCANYRADMSKSPVISVVSHSISKINAYNYHIKFIPNEVLDPVMKKFSIEVIKFLWPLEFSEMSNGFIIMIDKLEKLCDNIAHYLVESCSEYMQQARKYLIEMIKNQENYLKYVKEGTDLLGFSIETRSLREEILSFTPYQIVIRKIDPIKADALGIPMFVGSNHFMLDEVMVGFYEILRKKAVN